MSDWKSVALYGAADIERVCGMYEIAEHAKVPGGRFKIKVLESVDGDYVAVSNVSVKGPDGACAGRAGLGRTEVEALQAALKYFMDDLDRMVDPNPEDFCWTSPETF